MLAQLGEGADHDLQVFVMESEDLHRKLDMTIANLLALRGGTSWFTLYLVFHWQWPSALQSLLCRRFCYLCRDYKL